MDYYQKYLKYKNKYLNLKQLSGGGKDLILLNEISNYTCILFTGRYLAAINTKFRDIIPSNFISSADGFHQDPLIQFYNRTTEIYTNLINDQGWDKTKIGVVPAWTHPEQKKRTIITNCLPLTHQDLVFPPEKYINIKHDLDDSTYEMSKGGNFISSPPTSDATHGVIFCIDGIAENTKDLFANYSKQLVVELQCSFKFKTRNSKGIEISFRHIDEIMCFMPYGEGEFKVWFYDLDDKHSFKLEQETNLDKISRALFGKDYKYKKDKFFLVKLDIGTEQEHYLFPNPPIFNCLYVETRENRHLYLSNNNYERRILDELDKIESYITGDKVDFTLIDTRELHERGGVKPGGNLHCITKQQLKPPSKRC